MKKSELRKLIRKTINEIEMGKAGLRPRVPNRGKQLNEKKPVGT